MKKSLFLVIYFLIFSAIAVEKEKYSFCVLEGQNNAEIFERSISSMVKILGANPCCLDPNHPTCGKGLRGRGTGFVWHEDGYIVTNAHVVKNVYKLFASFYGEEKQYELKVVRMDVEKDIAIVKIVDSDSFFIPIKKGDSSRLKIGQKALGIGNALGLDFTMTAGIISGVEQLGKFSSGFTPHASIQTDASINPGSSGGVLLNSMGEAVGILTGIRSNVKENNGVGLAIPINKVKELFEGVVEYDDEVIEYDEVETSSKGMEYYPIFAEEENNGEIFERGVRSTVSVLRASPCCLDPNHPTCGKGPVARAAGFVWNKEGYIITSAYEVKNAYKLFVSFYGEEKQYEAEVVKLVEKQGIAVLKLVNPDGRSFVPIRKGDSSGLKVGQRALAIGSPFMLSFSLSSGIISGVNRKIKINDGDVISGLLQTDASLNPGNFGGVLFNSNGEVIGMNLIIQSKIMENNGVGFAIPISDVEKVVNSITSYKVERTNGKDKGDFFVLEEQENNNEIFKRSVESIVDVFTEGSKVSGGKNGLELKGAGLIWNKKGYVVTSAGVLKDANKIFCIFLPREKEI